MGAGSGALSSYTLGILDEAASVGTPQQPLERRQSMATVTSLKTLPEMEEDEEDDESSVSAATGAATGAATSNLHSPSPLRPSFSPLNRQDSGRPVLVTRERDTVQLDTTKVNTASLRKAEKDLKALLGDILFEERQMKFEQKKEAKRIDQIRRKQKLGVAMKRPRDLVPGGHWIDVVSVWQAQNGLMVKEKTDPSTFVVHSPDRIRVITRLAAVLVRLGDVSGAQQLWEDMFGCCVSDFGAEHPHTLAATCGLAYVLLEQNRVVLAELACRRGFSGLQKVVGNLHPMTRYARRLLIRIIHKLSLMKPQYYEEQERLLREDLSVEQHVLKIDGGTTSGGGGNSLYAHYNLASFCVHFGRYDEAAFVLRAAVATMGESMHQASLKLPLRSDMQILNESSGKVPGPPPKTPPKLEKCLYELKHMALNSLNRIRAEKKDYERTAAQWEEKVRATIKAGHPRSAGFYQTHIDSAKKSLLQLQEQEEEIRQQEIARDDLVVRRRMQENHTFERTVLRREKLDYKRVQSEAKVARMGPPVSERTHLDLLPQAWECVNMLAELLERRLRQLGRTVYNDESEQERKELDALLKWMEARQQEHEKVPSENEMDLVGMFYYSRS